MKQRRKNLLKHAQKIGCDTLVTFEPENLFYMTGFWGEAIGLLEKNGKTTIIAPELEVGRAKDESDDCDVITAERGTGLVTSLVKKIKRNHVCTDCQNYSIMTSLKKSIPKIKASTEPFYNSRIIKDENEIKILKKASKIIDEMFELCTKKIKENSKTINELSPHILRHTFATTMDSNGVSMKRLQKLLGHSNITTTSRYLHPTTEDLLQAIDTMDKEN